MFGEKDRKLNIRKSLILALSLVLAQQNGGQNKSELIFHHVLIESTFNFFFYSTLGIHSSIRQLNLHQRNIYSLHRKTDARTHARSHARKFIVCMSVKNRWTNITHTHTERERGATKTNHRHI